MLFESGTFESHKERNFYFKFFAGYFFNELIEGYDNRLGAFIQILDAKLGIRFPRQRMRVTFDAHLPKDPAEFADILLIGKDFFVAIEAKWLSDWDYKKDVAENAKRIDLATKELGRSQAIQCMLLTERKWEESRRHAEQKGSNYARLQDGKETLAHPFFVLTWEELVEACGNPRVRNYFTKAISHADKYAGTVSKEGQ